MPQPSAGSWPKQRRIEYFWMVSGRCNYRCPYCVYGLVPTDRRQTAQHYSAAQWLEGWERMHRRHGEGNIIMTGGEPTIYPGFDELVLKLGDWFWVAFDTNLSWPRERLARFLARARRERLSFEISFHPHSVDTQAFLERAQLVRDAGFSYINRLVAYPDLLGRLAGFRELFARKELTFVVNPFQGDYQGRRYPESYTAEERALISGASVNVEDNDANAPHKEFVRQILGRESPKGRLCRAGYQHVRIEDDATVYRCGEYATQRWEPLGSFFDQDLALWEAPRPCRCDCCEWEYRWLVDQAERFHNRWTEPCQNPAPTAP
ncbi:MAG: radical SAM protein [Elusimicrobia bacterium]|nr:radical SAM protein [Elusimicrobiota bacterium]